MILCNKNRKMFENVVKQVQPTANLKANHMFTRTLPYLIFLSETFWNSKNYRIRSMIGFGIDVNQYTHQVVDSSSRGHMTVVKTKYPKFLMSSPQQRNIFSRNVCFLYTVHNRWLQKVYCRNVARTEIYLAYVLFYSLRKSFAVFQHCSSDGCTHAVLQNLKSTYIVQQHSSSWMS